jgi:hypothetical protein
MSVDLDRTISMNVLLVPGFRRMGVQAKAALYERVRAEYESAELANIDAEAAERRIAGVERGQRAIAKRARAIEARQS